MVNYCPNVSVIIPIYKVEKLLGECLDSVVAQTLDNIEVICVNDGSPDGSADVAKAYTEKYDFVKLIHKENGGLSSARNAGLEAASGRYVYFLDSDDYIEPDTLEVLMKRADEDDLDIVYFNACPFFESKLIEKNNQNYVNYYKRKGDYPGVYTGQTMFSMMRKNREFLPSACLQLFRKDLLTLNDIRFYPGIVHEDNLFSFQCMAVAARVGYIDRSFYHRRMRDESTVTVKKTMRNVEGYLVSYAEILAFMRDKEVEASSFPEMSEYLYTSVFGNGRRIFRSLDVSNDDAYLNAGDFAADHFLDMIKRRTETEFERSRMKNEIAVLRGKVSELQRELNSIPTYRCKKAVSFFPRKIAGALCCIKDHGFAYTCRLAAKKLVRRLERCRLFGPVIRKLRNLRKRGIAYACRSLWVKPYMKIGGKQPFVSIIMPVYNVESFIAQGIKTLLNQTMKHIEIICVDDGSSDASVEILNRLAAQDHRLKVITQCNKGAGAARNLGIANAKGEYLIFLDSDDFFHSRLAEHTYQVAKQAKADVVLFGAKHYHNVTGQYRNAKWLLNTSVAPAKEPFSYKDCADSLYRITSPCPWTKAFRREFVLEKGLQFQELQNTNDLYFSYAALAMAERIVTVDEALVYYRVGLENNLQTTKKKYPFCFYDACRAWHDKLEELGVLEELRQSYTNAALSTCLFSLNSQKNPEVKQQIFDKLKTEIFYRLELADHDASYFYMRNRYEDMVQILTGTFDEYMNSHS